MKRLNAREIAILKYEHTEIAVLLTSDDRHARRLGRFVEKLVKHFELELAKVDTYYRLHRTVGKKTIRESYAQYCD